VLRLDLAALNSKTQGPGADVEEFRGLGQIHPTFGDALLGAVTGNPMMTTQCGDAFSRPAIAAPSQQAVAIEHASNQVVGTDSCEHFDGFNCFLRSMDIVLAATPPRQAQLGVYAALLVDDENDFARLGVNVDDDLANQHPNNALFQTGIGMGAFHTVARSAARFSNSSGVGAIGLL
jgi:hypothetical protein